ncbi:serine/threonine-protein phosphatase 7 long form-like protein [Senna tora]|uniref:Serine/threonine-protein phosphatase 7 long form-like protein n=1 Tax=Senna tora TaxID=362788 RepID=A0A834SWW7_9FABA|nr:serine/threonine-protein phosphatase 7 long form-like protein [Senna tora]
MDPIRKCARCIKAGPTDPSILYLQPRHRSEALWQGHDTPTVRPQHTRSTTYGYPPPAFVPLLIASGFYGASRTGFFPYDWHLVTALIMRWRPKTHTFHMAVGIGEITITLEDVAIQLGLPIEGKAANFPLEQGPWGDVSDEELRQMVRAYIVQLIGGFFMPDTSRNKVSLLCPPLLRNLEEAGQYSWGSAVLAYLFHEMCEATRWDCDNMGGCGHLLFAWAWDRFPTLAPRLRGRRARKLSAEDEAARYPIPCPLSARWSDYRTTSSELCSHNVTEYILKMDNMSPANVVWQPYIGPVLKGEIPGYCLHARDLGRAHVPLLYFHILEWQQADRVMRQHDMQQGIPGHPTDLDIQHTLKLTNKMHVHWPSRQFPLIQIWDQRWNRLVDAPKTTIPLAMHSTYMRWYKDITRKWVHPVRARTIVNGETYGVLADRVYEQSLPADEIAHIARRMQTLNRHPDLEGAGDHEATSASTFSYSSINGRDSSRSRPKKMSDSHPLSQSLKTLTHWVPSYVPLLHRFRRPRFLGKPSSEVTRNRSSRTTCPGSTHPLLGCWILYLYLPLLVRIWFIVTAFQALESGCESKQEAKDRCA